MCKGARKGRDSKVREDTQLMVGSPLKSCLFKLGTEFSLQMSTLEAERSSVSENLFRRCRNLFISPGQ